MLDAAALERRGIPTVTFVMRQFERAARAQAAQAGLPGLPIVVIREKVGWPTDAELDELASTLVDEAVHHLTRQGTGVGTGA